MCVRIISSELVFSHSPSTFPFTSMITWTFSLPSSLPTQRVRESQLSIPIIMLILSFHVVKNPSHRVLHWTHEWHNRIYLQSFNMSFLRVFGIFLNTTLRAYSMQWSATREWFFVWILKSPLRWSRGGRWSFLYFRQENGDCLRLFRNHLEHLKQQIMLSVIKFSNNE